MKRPDYNRIADEQSLNGWTFDDLVARLAHDASLAFMNCECEHRYACHHAAAAALDGLLRVIRHPDDCPECARLHAERSS